MADTRIPAPGQLGSALTDAPSTPQTIGEVLAFLIEHDTTSSTVAGQSKPTLPLLEKIRDFFESAGAHCTLAEETAADVVERYGKQGTLLIRVGPEAPGGVAYSGHVDVQPVQANQWNTVPMELHMVDDNYLARGAVDMKGQVANMLVTAHAMLDKAGLMEKPVYVLLSWGEEIGCRGTESAANLLKSSGATPDVILVAEPTESKVVEGHKGGMGIDITFKGKMGHSSDPEASLDCFPKAMEMYTFLKQLEADLAETHTDERFKPAKTIINIGQVSGGKSRNTTIGDVKLDVHVRDIPGVDVEKDILEPIRAKVAELSSELQATSRERGIENAGAQMEVVSRTLPLAPPSAAAMKGKELFADAYRGAYDMDAGAEVKPIHVSFATEAGGLSHAFPDSYTVVSHPGSLTKGNAHGNNEFIEAAELRQGCRLMLQLASLTCVGKDRLADAPDDLIMMQSAPARIKEPEQTKQL